MCLRCGASVDLPGDRADLPGRTLPGGPPNPAALVPSRKRRAASRGGSGSPRTTGRAAKGRGSSCRVESRHGLMAEHPGLER